LDLEFRWENQPAWESKFVHCNENDIFFAGFFEAVTSAVFLRLCSLLASWAVVTNIALNAHSGPFAFLGTPAKTAESVIHCERNNELAK